MGEMRALCLCQGSARPTPGKDMDKLEACIRPLRAITTPKPPNTPTLAPTWHILGTQGGWGLRSAHLGVVKEQPFPGWQSKCCALEEWPRGLCLPQWGQGKGGCGVGMALKPGWALGGGQGGWGRRGTRLGGRLGAVPSGGAPASRGPAVPRHAPPRAAC